MGVGVVSGGLVGPSGLGVGSGVEVGVGSGVSISSITISIGSASSPQASKVTGKKKRQRNIQMNGGNSIEPKKFGDFRTDG